jgi:hypothetical protein
MLIMMIGMISAGRDAGRWERCVGKLRRSELAGGGGVVAVVAEPDARGAPLTAARAESENNVDIDGIGRTCGQERRDSCSASSHGTSFMQRSLLSLDNAIICLRSTLYVP